MGGERVKAIVYSPVILAATQKEAILFYFTFQSRWLVCVSNVRGPFLSTGP